MGSYFIFYDAMTDLSDFVYDEIDGKTYAKVKLSLYRVNDTAPHTTKLSEKVELIDINIINKQYRYSKKLELDAKDDSSAILLFQLIGGDFSG